MRTFISVPRISGFNIIERLHCTHTRHWGAHLVESLEEAKVVLSRESKVIPSQPVGEGKGVVHEGGVEEGEERRGAAQTQTVCVCVNYHYKHL